MHTLNLLLPILHLYFIPCPSLASTLSADDPYALLSSAIVDRIRSDPAASPSASPASLRRALKSLSSAQATLKGIDGASHELYQRTHKSDAAELKEGEAPTGRATRSAARLGCVADGLFAAELCELSERPELIALETNEEIDGGEGPGAGDDTLSAGGGRDVWLNVTVRADAVDALPINVLVLHEPMYDGGAGLTHGGIDGVLERERRPPRGRILVVLRDPHRNHLASTVEALDVEPTRLSFGPSRSASVNGPLHAAAGAVLDTIRPVLKRAEERAIGEHDCSVSGESPSNDQDEDEPAARSAPPFAIHFVGRSLAGGVAGLAACILDGRLPLLVAERGQDDEGGVSLFGYGRERSSAVALGPPPCLSRSVKADFVTSVIHGDDAICRTTRDSLDRLCRRAKRAMKGGVLGAKMSWMNSAASLTISGVKTYAKGSKEEGCTLSLPGKAYLIRPRRYEGSSIHEVSSSAGKGKIRSAILWQLNDVLLSRSLWRHHALDAYIKSLDQVQLRTFKASNAYNE